MDKQKQIDEMARILTPCPRNTCVGCGMECIDYRMAKAIYNAGYRNLGGNSCYVPCKIGDTVYTNFHWRGDYLRKKDAPYPVKVVFIGINDCAEHGGGFINVEYKTGRQWQFNFADFGKIVFLTREEAKGGDNGKQES